MDILLHIGPAKTGSTSIQKTLHGYDDGTTKYLEFQRQTHRNAWDKARSDICSKQPRKNNNSL